MPKFYNKEKRENYITLLYIDTISLWDIYTIIFYPCLHLDDSLTARLKEISEFILKDVPDKNIRHHFNISTNHDSKFVT